MKKLLIFNLAKLPIASKNCTNQSIEKLEAYNGLLINLDALNSLQFSDALGINKFWAR